MNAKCCEKIWFEGGIECGEDAGKVCVITCALYRLKSAGALWQVELAQLLRDLRYESMKADADVWIHKALVDMGHEYYEMLFVYVNDILSISLYTKVIPYTKTDIYNNSVMHQYSFYQPQCQGSHQ